MTLQELRDEGDDPPVWGGRGRRASAARRPLGRRRRALTWYRAIRQLRGSHEDQKVKYHWMLP